MGQTEEHRWMTLSEENKILKAFLKDKKVFINWGSKDCDNVGAHGSHSFDSLEAIESWIESSINGAEGPWGWEQVSQEDAQENVSGYGGWEQ